MALYTDGPISSIEELTARDSQLLSVASTEGIDLTQKIALAQDELSLELGGMLTATGSLLQGVWTSPAGVHSIVVTPALKLWHVLRTLELVYCDAYHNELNDRYAGKRDQFRKMARWAYEQLAQAGIGIALNPVPKAATPDVYVTGSVVDSLPDGAYYVATAWINGQGDEGCNSNPAVVTTVASTVSVAAGAVPEGAAGWNVYVGTAPETLMLQNGAPLAGGTVWRQPAMLANGRQPGAGQAPNVLRPIRQFIQRG